MRKFLFFLLLCPLIASAQSSLPSYPAVVKTFFKTYSYTSDDPMLGIEFVKRKDGWHIVIIDRLAGEVKKDQHFWSETSGYVPLEDMKSALPKDEASEQINNLLFGPYFIDFYNFERCQYFGYAGWDKDMIDEFGKGEIIKYPDTLIEGLARAYSSYAEKFLWHPYVYNSPNPHPLHKKLGPTEKPSQERIDSACFYFKKGIETYEILNTKNPAYQTRIGNAGMRLFSETFHANHQMRIAGNENKAGEFFRMIKPNRFLSDYAKNYLKMLPPNTILFSYGDNDTYPLLFIQQSENFRKDVVVINTSLLGLPRYLHMLKEKNIVKFSTTSNSYTDPGFNYIHFEAQEKAPPSLPLKQLIEMIQSKKYPIELIEVNASYPQKNISLAIDLVAFEKIKKQSNLTNKLNFSLGNYLGSEQFMVLDILSSNMYNYPIYFSSPFDLFAWCMQQEGLTYQFLPIDPQNHKPTEEIAMKNTEFFINNVYKITRSDDQSTGVSTNEDFAPYLYTQLAWGYLEKNQKEKAKELFKRLLKEYNNKIPFGIINFKLAVKMMETGEITQGIKIMEEFAKKMFELYKEPAANYAISGVMVRAYIDEIVDRLKELKIKSSVINDIQVNIHKD